MKIQTILMILSLSLASAKAAKLTVIKQGQSPVLGKISKHLKVLSPFKTTDLKFKEYGFAISVVNQETCIEEILEQAIEQEYQEEYSRPEFVHIMSLRKKDLHNEMLMIVEPFEVYAKVRNISIDFLEDALMRVDHLIKAHSTIKVFSLNQGNMFGEGIGVIIFDSSTNEFLILERLYQD